MNRQVAMHVLRSKLYELALQERQDELASVVGDKKESTWGSQIRSYVLHPYTLAKDHRTGVEKGNVHAAPALTGPVYLRVGKLPVPVVTEPLAGVRITGTGL